MRVETQRTQPRVAFPADVRIVRAGRSQPIAGRAVNLSPTGLFVETKIACAVGTDLVCEIPLPGGQRRLRGKVTRTQTMTPESVGLGIQFIDLAHEDEAVLRGLVHRSEGRVGGADDRSHLVKVRFEGLGQALRSRATVTKEGIRLSTALPFLRLSSNVDVSFIAGSSRIESRGVLTNVGLEPSPNDGVPRLAVDLTLKTPAPESENGLEDDAVGLAGPSPRSTVLLPGSSSRRRTKAPSERPHAVPADRHVREPGWSEVFATATPTPRPHAGLERGEAGKADVAENADIDRADDRQPEAVAGRRRARGSVTRLFVPAALGFLAVVAIIHQRAIAQLERRAARQAIAVSERETIARRETTSEVTVDAPAAVTTPETARAAANARAVAATARMVAVETGLDTPRAGAENDLNARTTHVVADTSLNARTTHVVADTSLDARTTHARVESYRHAHRPMPTPMALNEPGPAIEVTGAEATATVPITGSTAGMVHYSLGQPRGLLVNLPHAQSALPLGHYWTRRHGFRVVWIRALAGGGTQIRYAFTAPEPDEELLELEDGAVKVRVRLPAR